MRRAYVDTPEGQVHYVTEGSGPPLLLLHQTPTSYREFENMIPLLSSRFRVVAMDLMGHGSSDVPPDDFTVEDYARNVVHVLDALGIAKTHVFGHHSGAIIAVEAAASAPDRFDRLVLSGCAAWDKEAREANLELPHYHVRDMLDKDGPIPPQITNTWELWRKFAKPGQSPKVWWPGFAAVMQQGGRYHDLHLAVFRYDILARIPLVKQPTLLLFGTRDQFMIGFRERALELFPKAEAKVIEDAGVLVAYEMPEALAAEILRFINQ